VYFPAKKQGDFIAFSKCFTQRCNIIVTKYYPSVLHHLFLSQCSDKHVTINWKKRRAQEDLDHGICYLGHNSLPHTIYNWWICMDCIKEVKENTNNHDRVGVHLVRSSSLCQPQEQDIPLAYHHNCDCAIVKGIEFPNQKYKI
jgi:hypothetical protein